jgi:hypothetical protein
MIIRSRRSVPWAVAILLASASPAVARIRPGLELGTNVSTIDYFDELPWWNNGWRASFTGGVVVEFPLGDRLALTSGLRYVQQGNRVEVNIPALVGEFRVVQNYLAVPAWFELHPFPARGFFLSLGPEVGFLLSGQVEEEYTTYGFPPTQFDGTMDIGSILEDVNVAIDAGAGFSFPLAGHVGIVQARYSQGITSAAKKDQWFSDWKTQGVEFLAGMRW